MTYVINSDDLYDKEYNINKGKIKVKNDTTLIFTKTLYNTN